MKNYTTDELKTTTFIERYQQKDEQLIINYADKENSTVSKSIENEKRILEKMKQQVLDSEQSKQEIIGVIQICKFIIITVLILGIVGTSLISYFFAKSIIDTLAVGLVTLLFSAPAYLGMGITIRDQKEILKDIEKNQIFIQNEVLFQTKITKDINNQKHIKKETKEIVNNILKIKEQETKDIIRPTINDIDKIPYEIFMELYKSINEDEKNNPKRKILRKKGI